MVVQVDAGHIVKPSIEEFSAKNCPKGGFILKPSPTCTAVLIPENLTSTECP